MSSSELLIDFTIRRNFRRIAIVALIPKAGWVVETAQHDNEAGAGENGAGPRQLSHE